MKRSFFTVLCIFSIFLFASCDLLGGSLAQYVEEYTTSAAIEAHYIDSAYLRSVDGTSCLSADNTKVVLMLRNPTHRNCGFEFIFNNGTVQNWYTANYANQIQFASERQDNTAYTMTFPSEFLKEIDSCELISDSGPIKDISGTVIMFDEETLNPFGTYNLSLRADTVPNPPEGAILQLDEPATSSDAKYIACFKIKQSTFNYDFDTIKINNDVWKISYTDGVMEITPQGTSKGQLLLNPEKKPVLYPLEEGGATFKPEPGYDVFYYISSDIRKDSETAYIIKVSDYAGLSTSAKVSSQTEKLTAVTISFTPSEGQIVTADDNGFYTVSVFHDGQTLKGEPLVSTAEITCFIDDESGNSNIVKGPSPLTLTIPIGKGYTISANATCAGYLSNSEIVTSSFSVKHSPQFYISSSGNDDGEGTANAPFRTFHACIDEIITYKEDYGEPVNGVFINVLSDISPTDTDFATYTINTISGSETIVQDRLISNYSLKLGKSLNGKTTIRGVDASGSEPMRTIDVRGSSSTAGNRGVLAWSGNSTLTVENLTFTGGYGTDFTGAGAYLFAALTDEGQQEVLNATFKNCTFTGNTITSSSKDAVSGGAGLAIRAGYNENTKIILEDCAIENNEVTGLATGAGLLLDTWNATGRSGIVELKGTTTVTKNRSGANTAGIYSNGNLVIESASVVISDNYCSTYTPMAGIYAGSNGTLTIKGATIKDNTAEGKEQSNLYLADTATVTVADDLTGSIIFVTAENEPVTEVDASVPFATYDAAYKPAKGIFVSDNGTPIKLGTTTALLDRACVSDISGSIVIPSQFYDDILMHAEKIDNDDGSVTINLSFTDNSGTVLDDVEITDLLMYCRGENIPQGEYAWMYDKASQTVTYSNVFTIRMQSTDSYPTLTVIFEYNGHIYSVEA